LDLHLVLNLFDKASEVLKILTVNKVAGLNFSYVSRLFNQQVCSTQHATVYFAATSACNRHFYRSEVYNYCFITWFVSVTRQFIKYSAYFCSSTERSNFATSLWLLVQSTSIIVNHSFCAKMCCSVQTVLTIRSIILHSKYFIANVQVVIFCVVTPWRLVFGHWRHGRTPVYTKWTLYLHIGDGGSTYLRNVGVHEKDCKVSRSRRPQSQQYCRKNLNT
jgi:hypothetical protein